LILEKNVLDQSCLV